jgi:hypothetical protein
MKMLKLRFHRIGVDYDNGYGVFNRTGWSFSYDGSYVVEFSKWFIIGYVKLVYYIIKK